MAEHRPKPDRTRGDGIGIVIATACLIHCVVVSFLAVLVPWFLIPLGPGQGVHEALAFLSSFIAMATLLPGFQNHHKRRVLMFGGIGVGLLVVGALAPQDLCCNLCPALIESGTLPPLTLQNCIVAASTPIGCCFLVTAHVMNRRCCHSCKGLPE